jgi:hypothetical protein
MAKILRFHLKKGQAGLKKASDIIVDQIREIATGDSRITLE